MENRLYSLDEVAQLMGKTPAEINEMRMHGQIYGMRDGSSWKFKGQDVEKLLHPVQEQAYDEDYALAGGSSLSLTDSSPEEDKGLAVDTSVPESSDIMNASALDINSTLDSGSPSSISQGMADVLDVGDDDLLLGESDVMSDVTLNGESSGINLYKPEGDSGLSLDDGSLSGKLSGIDFGGDNLNNTTDGGSMAMGSDVLSVDDNLELDGESLSIIDDGSGTAPDSIEEFTLTTTPDDIEDESDTGSQVIALSESDSSDFSDPLMGVGPGSLDTGAGAVDMGLDSGAAPMADTGLYGGVLPPDVTPELIETAREIGLKDKPYTILNIIGLFLCVALLVMTLIMTVDLVRNMWSWNQPYAINSNLMDWLLKYFN